MRSQRTTGHFATNVNKKAAQNPNVDGHKMSLVTNGGNYNPSLGPNPVKTRLASDGGCCDDIIERKNVAPLNIDNKCCN